MKLEYFRGDPPNFGDELNAWLWPQLLPGFLDNDPSVLFLGIGSIIGSHYEASAKKIIFGTGYVPSYHADAPNVRGENWDVFFVRGPRTAHALGLKESLGIGDAATLIRALGTDFRREPQYVGFMPHWESMRRGDWHTVCELAGLRLIDPTSPVDQVITDLLRCEVLIAEAMHGAIVADALRVPWIPVLPIHHMNRAKWYDWADSLSLKLIRHRLLPSTATEAQILLTNRPFLSSFTGCLNLPALSWMTKPAITHLAAHYLSHIAKSAPVLSNDNILDTVLEQMIGKLDQLTERYNVKAASA